MILAAVSTNFLFGVVCGSAGLFGVQVLVVEFRRYRRIKRGRRMGFVSHGRDRLGR